MRTCTQQGRTSCCRAEATYVEGVLCCKACYEEVDIIPTSEDKFANEHCDPHNPCDDCELEAELAKHEARREP